MERFWETITELGIPRDVVEHLRVEKSAKGYRLSTPELDGIPKTPNDSYGLLSVRTNGKPTSFFARAMHKHIKKRENVSTEELEKLLYGECVNRDGRGRCLVVWDGVPIGVGVFSGNCLRLEMPKDDIMRARAGFKRILQR